jgi:hypothetical protein
MPLVGALYESGGAGVPGTDFRFAGGNEKLTASCFKAANFSQTKTNRKKSPAISLRLKRRFLYGKSRFHLYHYAGNNPLKYTDPDGRTPKSYYISLDPTTGKERYGFSSSGSTWDGAVDAGLSGIFPIPFVGDPIVSAVNALYGFKKIDVKSASSTLSGAASKLIDGVSLGVTIVKFLGNKSSLMSVAGKASTIATYLLTGANVMYELSQADSVGMDNMIEKILGRDLIAGSHEDVGALYAYAKSEMTKLKKEGVFSYSTNRRGAITSCRFRNSDFDILRQELAALKAAMEK